MDEVHAELGREESERRADLRTVADEHHLAVLEALAARQILENGAEVADLLRRMVVVRHSV